MREIRLLRSMSGVWRRSYGRPTKAPPDERGGNRHGRPNTTAPHPDSTPNSVTESGRLNAVFGFIAFAMAIVVITIDGFGPRTLALALEAIAH